MRTVAFSEVDAKRILTATRRMERVPANQRRSFDRPRQLNAPTAIVGPTGPIDGETNLQPAEWYEFDVDTTQFAAIDDCWVIELNGRVLDPTELYFARRIGTRPSDGLHVYGVECCCCPEPNYYPSGSGIDPEPEESGSGLGGYPVTVPCSENPINSILVGTITNKTGDCACLPDEILFEYIGLVGPAHVWRSVFDPAGETCTECRLEVGCLGSSFSFDGPLPEKCSRFETNITYSTDPFVLVYDVENQAGDACNGDYRITITEPA